ncbi:MAG: hypothetical protein LUG93_07300 [Lachnospiraceae bacterium]|nr:hypothetical protein [Lachnospiraceae bacterium]
MARKKRCTLCGGKLLPSGICAECGWDNSKNDEGYRLNTHNEAGMRLHSGDCEDVLNKENPHRQAKASGTGTDSAEKTRTAHSRSERTSAGGTRSGREKTSANTRSQTKKMSADDHRPKNVDKPVRKKYTLLKWLVVLFFAWVILDMVFSDEFSEARWFLNDLVSEIRETLEDSGLWNDDFYEDDEWVYGLDDEEAVDEDPEPTDTDESPERVSWDESAEGYVSLELAQGYYYVGYEVPAGNYQLECLTDSAMIYIYQTPEENSSYDFLILYSREEQEAYLDYMNGTQCPWYDLSPVITLEEGMILAIYGESSEMWLTGEGEGMDSLSDHEEQSLKDVLLERDKTLTVGMDGFEAGNYDIVASGEDPDAYVEIETKDGYYKSMILYGKWTEFLRFPFEEGDTISVILYNDDTEVFLRSAW